MRQFFHWFRKRVQTFELFPDYFDAIAQRWQDLLWGASVLAIAFSLWWFLGNPPTWTIAVYLAGVMLVAGYYTWRADHVRLVPRFEIKNVCTEPTPTSDPKESRVYIQVLPECLTEAPVNECQGHLVRVRKWSNADGWRETQINEPLDLAWSMHDASPLTLHPGVPQRLNVCWITNQGKITPDAPKGVPLRAAEVFNTTDKFRFEIRVTAKNCPPVDAFVVLQMGRQWDQPIVSIET
jgi:hypothetical protein